MKPQTEYLKRTFVYSGSKIWNNLTHSLTYSAFLSFSFNRTIISKQENIAPNFADVFHLVIQDYNLTFSYRTASGNVSVTHLQSQAEKLKADEWHLIIVSVIDRGLSYYIDGELMNANSVMLTGPISDQGGTVRIGQKYGG